MATSQSQINQTQNSDIQESPVLASSEIVEAEKEVSLEIPSENTSEGIQEKRIACKFYLTPGGCKNGNACKYVHTKPEPKPQAVEFNSQGLPIRMGVKICGFYMRTGTCRFGRKCRFNHPDPGSDEAAGFITSAYPVGQVGVYPLENIPCEYSPFYPSVPPYYSTVVSEVADAASTSALPQVAAENGAYRVIDNKPRNHSGLANKGRGKQGLYENVQNLPQRPGQADCLFYMNRGTCILASDCRFHHPIERIPSVSDIVYTKKGLGLKPGGVVCHVYDTHGICKFGPTCPYDHPLARDPEVPARVYMPPRRSVRRQMGAWHGQYGRFSEQLNVIPSR